MKKRKVPMRMCIGCQEMKPKKELIRVVKNKEGEISIDLTGRSHGRGAYLCKNRACMDKALKSRKLEKNFSCSIDSHIFDMLKEQLEEI